MSRDKLKSQPAARANSGAVPHRGSAFVIGEEKKEILRFNPRWKSERKDYAHKEKKA